MGRQISGVHDHLFKLTLELPGVAGALLRERLPPAIAVQLADAEPEPVPADFIDDQLSELRPDLIFRLRLRTGEPLYCILEHKSVLDVLLGFQLLGYLNALWQALRKLAGRFERLPLIIPLVVYNGASAWKGPRRFSDGLDAAGTPVKLGLDFPIEVFDLGRGKESRLSAMPWLRGALRLLRHGVRIPSPELAKRLLVEILADLRGVPDPYLLAACHYILDRWESITQQDLVEAVRAAAPDREDLVVSKAARDWLDQGRVEGERATLLVLLEQKFGPLSDPVRERVGVASLEKVELWVKRLLDATSLAEVFDEGDE